MIRWIDRTYQRASMLERRAWQFLVVAMWIIYPLWLFYDIAAGIPFSFRNHFARVWLFSSLSFVNCVWCCFTLHIWWKFTGKDDY